MTTIEHQATSKSNRDSKTCLEPIGVFLYNRKKLPRDGHGLAQKGNVN
jgi:hypothetical protein